MCWQILGSLTSKLPPARTDSVADNAEYAHYDTQEQVGHGTPKEQTPFSVLQQEQGRK